MILLFPVVLKAQAHEAGWIQATMATKAQALKMYKPYIFCYDEQTLLNCRILAYAVI